MGLVAYALMLAVAFGGAIGLYFVLRTVKLI
ncbi:MAG: cytochrome B6 [Cyanobacteria bacterium J069]|nr:MAG: cytochrome B6 [Cyanobacteria bacterium J069]